MDLGARADVVDDNGRTVLHTIASQKPSNYSLSLFRRLIKDGADLETRDSEGNTALQVAAKVNNIQLLKAHEAMASDCTIEGNTGFAKTLPYSLCHNLKDTNPRLHSAVECRDWKTVQDLIKKGENINKPDSGGLTVIQKLVQHKYQGRTENLFSFMVNRGANVYIRTPDGDNLLHLAAKHNNWPIVELLVKLGFSGSEPDSEGLCVLHRIAQDRTINLTSLFPFLSKVGVSTITSVSNSSGDSLLQLAAKYKNTPLFQYLLQRSDIKIINQLDSEGLNLLHRSVMYQPGYRERRKADCILNTLLNMGANPNIRTSSGDTALHLAAKHNKWNVIKRLVEHGCDVNDPDSEGFFAIHRLAQTKAFLHESLKSPEEATSKVLRLLLHKRADLSVRCPAGNTALHLAARHHNWNLVERLIDQGYDLSTADSEGFYVLHRFAQKDRKDGDGRFLSFTSNDVSSTALFLKFVGKGADLNCKSSETETPLHIALKNQKWELAKRLAELGADVRACDCNGMTVLHIIAKQELCDDQLQCITLIQFLIEKGADVKVRCTKGDSFLHLAAKHDNWEIVQQMISHTACNDEDVNEKDSEGFTILHRAAGRQRSRDNSSLVQVLLSKGAKYDIPCPSGECALHLAVKHGSWRMIRELLQYKDNKSQLSTTLNQRYFLKISREVRQNIKSLPGFNIDTMDASGNTILHLCAKQRKWDQVYELLMSGADPGLTDDEGHTILFRLSTEDRDTTDQDQIRSKVLQFLRPNITSSGEIDEFGDTLLHIAARNRNLRLVHILVHLENRVNGADIHGLTLLHKIVKCKSPKSLDIVRTLLNKNENIEARCPKGNTPLHLASQCDNWDIVKELLRKGAKAGDTDSEGMTVLQRFVRRTTSSCQLKRYWEWDTVQALLKCGAVVDQNAVRGKSLLHELAKDTRVPFEVAKSVIKQLVTRGLDLNKRDSAGDTPLNLASKHKNWSTVRAFTEVGADASIPDSEGWFVCHRLAMDSGYRDTNVSDLLSFLTSNGFDVNQKGPNGRSSLQTALEHRKWKTVWGLVQLGASYELSLNEKKIILKNVLELPGINTDQKKIKSFISHIIDKDPCTSIEMQLEIGLCERKALKQLILWSKWAFAKTLVECGSYINDDDEPLVHFVVSKYLRLDHAVWVSFLDALLARGVDINRRDDQGRTVLFRNMRRYFSDCGMDDTGSLLHVLLDRGADPSIADAEGISLLREAVKLENRSAIEAVRFLIELGVSTHQPTLTDAASTQTFAVCYSSYFNRSIRSPTQTAFEKNNVVAFKMLVESGASSNKELFELNTRYQVQLAFKDRKSLAEIEMLEILRDAASEPRSLKSLCRLTVSHALGCGPRRKEKVVTLPIPGFLRDYILFCDVLTVNFTSL